VSVIFVPIAASISLLARAVGERCRTRVGARPWPRTTETWLSKDVDETRPISSGVGRDFVAEDVRVGRSSRTTLDLPEGLGVCSRANGFIELGRGNGKVERDWRSETIAERRLVIELCISCGLEILARSLSLRVPDRNSLALSVSRMRNSSLWSGLENTLSYKKNKFGETRTLLLHQ
jgi:hypothetical protein